MDSIVIEQINIIQQSEIIKELKSQNQYNPNYLSDYQGYLIGLTTSQIDAIRVFRDDGGYFNSFEEFQKVAKLKADSTTILRNKLKFPINHTGKFSTTSYDPKRKNKVTDLNRATEDDFKSIKGVGTVLSKRIISFRNRLGGFVLADQLYDVFGLDSLIAKDIITRFPLNEKPIIIKLNINKATAEELATIGYINLPLAQRVVSYREKKGHIQTWSELSNVYKFPLDKINRIKLYLEL